MDKAKETYEKPQLYELGKVKNLTLGNGGSSLDGNFSVDQRGQGNDGSGPHGG